MKFFSNKIILQAYIPFKEVPAEPAPSLPEPDFHPFKSFETPAHQAFSATDPTALKKIGLGVKGAFFHLNDNNYPTAVAKSGPDNAIKEPMIHQIVERHFAPGLVPMTVTRKHKTPDTTKTERIPGDKWGEWKKVKQKVPGAYTDHSVQQFVDGLIPGYSDAHNHPDFHKWRCWIIYLEIPIGIV